MSREIINTNSILSAILIALSAWILHTVHSLHVTVGKIETDIVYIKQNEEANKERDKQIHALERNIATLRAMCATNK